MLAELERCQLCNVRYEDHDVQNKCTGFLSATDARKIAKQNAEALQSKLTTKDLEKEPNHE